MKTIQDLSSLRTLHCVFPLLFLLECLSKLATGRVLRCMKSDDKFAFNIKNKLVIALDFFLFMTRLVISTPYNLA